MISCDISEEDRVPWMGTLFGGITGLIIVIGDEFATAKPAIPVCYNKPIVFIHYSEFISISVMTLYFQYLIIKIFLVVALAGIGYGVAIAYRSESKS